MSAPLGGFIVEGIVRCCAQAIVDGLVIVETVGVTGMIGVALEGGVFENSGSNNNTLRTLGKVIQAVFGGGIFIASFASSLGAAATPLYLLMIAAPIVAVIIKNGSANYLVKKTASIIDTGIGLLSKIGTVAACVLPVALISYNTSVFLGIVCTLCSVKAIDFSPILNDRRQLEHASL